MPKIYGLEKKQKYNRIVAAARRLYDKHRSRGFHMRWDTETGTLIAIRRHGRKKERVVHNLGDYNYQRSWAIEPQWWPEYDNTTGEFVGWYVR